MALVIDFYRFLFHICPIFVPQQKSVNSDAEIILKASIFDQVLYEAVKICREIPEADAMAEDTFIDDRNNFRWKDVLSTGLRVFIAGIDGATGVAQVSGGGGTSNDMP